MKLQHRNIFGRIVKVEGGEGVTKVTSLPATGEEGKIYYNTTDKKYYVYSTTDTQFKELTMTLPGIPIATEIKHGTAYAETEASIDENNDFILEPNKYYDLNTFILFTSTALDNTDYPAIGIEFEDIDENDGYARQYVWKLELADWDSITMLLPNLIIPESTKDILDNLEKDHTYEFNLLNKVLFVADITDVANS